MSLSFCSFASGSSGNSFLVKGEEGALLIDAGISASRILKGLERAEVQREELKAIFITHEHSDHISGLRVLTKKLPHAQVFASEGTLAAIEEDLLKNETASESISPEKPIQIAGFIVSAFRTLHDAEEPFGYIVSGEGKSVAIATDTGIFADEILMGVLDADALVLEANHDEEMLRRGAYPPYLKQRILGERGHLSNEQTGEALCRIYAENPKKRAVFLAHLSNENNTPKTAEVAVCTRLAKSGIFTGEDLFVGVLKRDVASPLYHL